MASSARYDDYAGWYDAQLARFTGQARPFIREWLGAGAGRCLDLGCGGGVQLVAIAELGWSAVGLDISRNQLRIAHERRGARALVQADATRAPFGDASFDAVVAGFAQLQGGVYHGHRVLSPSGVEQMHTGVVEAGTGGSYGMGWVQDTYNGTTVISHDGDSLNMHSEMILVPALGWGVELIISSSSVPVLMTASVDATARGVVSMLMGSAEPSVVSPIATYLAFDVVALVLVAVLLWSLVRAARARLSPVRGVLSLLRHVVLPFGWRLALAVVAVAVIVVFAQQVGASFQLIAGTDLGVTLLLIASLLLVNALVRVVRRVSVGRPSPRLAHARTADPSLGITVRP